VQEPLILLVRRVCVLRALGRHDEAAALELREFGPTLEQLRSSNEPGAFSDAAVAALWSEERLRVSEAAVLAELLAQWMRVPALPGAIERRGTASASTSPLRPHRSDSAPVITDLLDQMLAGESPARSA